MTPSPNGFRVLVAEDVDSLAELMRYLLEEEGYLVETASDGEVCLKKITTFKPDLVILDIMMPKINGMEIIQILRAFHRTQSVGVIVCTAKDYKTDRDRIRDMGVDQFITKPFEPSVFTEAVNRFFSPNPSAGPGPVTAEEAGAPAYQPQLNEDKHRFKLWGTRGSTPVSHPRFMKHGGNTPCLSVQSGDELIILDAGTGIRELGLLLVKSPIRKIHLFVGHTHWDHIQGFPFFAPAFVPGFELSIYGAAGFGKDLRAVFQGQLDQDYFPVQLEDMRSTMNFRVLKENPVQIGDVSVHWEFVNHPGAAVGFKLSAGGKNLVYITDNEFLEGYTGPPQALDWNHPAVVPYRPMIDFVTGADLLIHEAQYTNRDYPEKITWGHSSVSNACVLVKLARINKWVITHHDPGYDDESLDQKLLLTEQILDELGCTVSVTNAYDGMEILL
jgi:CheY-like chemotaxis protein